MKYCIKRLSLLFSLTLIVSNLWSATDIPDYTLSQRDEGFQWKKSFNITVASKTIDIEPEHSKLYNHVNECRKNLNDLTTDKLLEDIKNLMFPDDQEGNSYLDPKIKNIFFELQGLKEKVSDVYKPEDFAREMFSKPKNNNDERDPKVRLRSIIKENLDRLKNEGRNYCAASFTVIHQDGTSNQIPITTFDTSLRQIIFVSGTGNEIARLLEHTPLFKKIAFCIMTYEPKDKDDNSGLNIAADWLIKGGISGLIEYAEDLLQKDKDNLEFSKELLNKVEELSIAKDKLDNEIGKLNKDLKTQIKTNRHDVVEGILSDVDILKNQSKLRRAQAQKVEKQSLQSKLLCHSEQALRLYLWINAEKFSDIIASKDSKVCLNIHTERDPCERCAHSLLLEGLVSALNPQARPAKIRKNSNEQYYEAVGGIQNINLKKASNDDTETLFQNPLIKNPYILVSSQKPVPGEGLLRRWVNLALYKNEERFDGPILMDSETCLYFRHNGPQSLIQNCNI